jgi:hypothetical protein
VRDRVRFAVPGDFRGEVLDAWVGWYVGSERLHLSDPGASRHDGHDRLLLAPLPVSRMPAR